MSHLTKKAIADAFNALIHKKPFSKISISDITGECGISRMTFYYHFADIYDMIDWTLREKLKRTIDTHFTHATWEQGYLSVFLMTQEDAEFFLKVFPDSDIRKLEKFLMSIADKFIEPVYNEVKGDLEVSESNKTLIIKTYAFALIGFYLQWIEEGMKDSPEKLVDGFARIFRGTLRLALEKAAQ